MAQRNHSFGRWGERLAERYLLARGDTLVDRNVRTPYGEIDLITRRDSRLVFVEVKTRGSDRFGYPEESVHEQKMARLIESAQEVLERINWLNDWQIDVIAIRRFPDRPPEIHHIENALL